jgi:hypothetical protein
MRAQVGEDALPPGDIALFLQPGLAGGGEAFVEVGAQARVAEGIALIRTVTDHESPDRPESVVQCPGIQVRLGRTD